MVRFGIVGAGGIAQKFARDIKFVKEAKLTAVAARSEEQALVYKEAYQVEYAFSSYEAMAKSDKIDAVYIAVPHNFHHDLAILFMKNKKAVLVEKPIAVNKKELESMMACAKEHQVLLMEALWTVFLPSTTYIKKIIDSKTLGGLKEASINLGYQLTNQYPVSGRLLNKDLAGGSLLDLGIYPISFYNFIKQSSIKELNAKAHFTSTGVDASVNIFVTDFNSASITIKCSLEENFDNDALLVFEKGIIKMIDFSRSNKLYIDDNEVYIPYEGEGFVDEIRSFCRSFLDKEIENYTINLRQSYESIKLMDEIREIIKLRYPFE